MREAKWTPVALTQDTDRAWSVGEIQSVLDLRACGGTQRSGPVVGFIASLWEQQPHYGPRLAQRARDSVKVAWSKRSLNDETEGYGHRSDPDSEVCLWKAPTN